MACCAIGADHASEQVNRWMKVSGGILGITQKQSARTRFFLVALELARLKVEAKQNAGVKQEHPTKHYELSNVARNKLFVPDLSLTTTWQAYTNPFEKNGYDIINIVTKAVVADDVKKRIRNS